MIPPTDGPPSGRAPSERLRGAAGVIRRLWPPRNGFDAILLGEALVRARELCPHGTWRGWLAKHFPASYPHAHRLMSLAKFSAQKSQLERFDLSVLYLMANRPDLSKALAGHAQRGERVRWTDAVEALGPAEMPQSRQHRAWDALEELTAGADMVHISLDRDGDRDGEPLDTITVRAVLANGSRVSVCRQDLDLAVAAALGREATKVCRTCGLAKALPEFARSKRGRDGRQGRCRACEAVRVRTHVRGKAN